jgi:large subunit ribosomal protein L29
MNAKEVHKLSDQELVEEESRLRRKLFDLRSQSVTQKLENPHAISAMRRDVARLITERKVRLAKQAKA